MFVGEHPKRTPLQQVSGLSDWNFLGDPYPFDHTVQPGKDIRLTGIQLELNHHPIRVFRGEQANGQQMALALPGKPADRGRGLIQYEALARSIHPD